MPIDLASLIAALKSSEPAEVQAAAEQLSQLGSDAQPAAVALVEACVTEDGDTRELVVAALEELGPPAEHDVAPLARLLQSESLDVAYWAATLLGRLGEKAAAAVNELTVALTGHPQLPVRERAAWALGQIGPAAGSARVALEQAAAGTDRRLATLAAEALRSISA